MIEARHARSNGSARPLEGVSTNGLRTCKPVVVVDDRGPKSNPLAGVEVTQILVVTDTRRSKPSGPRFSALRSTAGTNRALCSASVGPGFCS